MKPVRTKETNRTFKLPGGTEENDLPLVATVDENDNAVLVSTWELTSEERRLISIGRPVTLTVWGLGTPPVALSVEA